VRRAPEAAVRTVDLNAAKVHLSRLLDQIAAGEEIMIATDGKPVARLLPYETRREASRPGLMKGRIWISEHFDGPLPEEIMAVFRGDRP
jgi:prevent-host-death family protein